jgi:hypothetical protein
VTSGRILCGPALAINGALLIGGLAGWLLGAHPPPAATPAFHKPPRMIVPSAFPPDRDEDPGPCDQAADMVAEPVIMDLRWVTCYGADMTESATVGQRDPQAPSMAVFRP